MQAYSAELQTFNLVSAGGAVREDVEKRWQENRLLAVLPKRDRARLFLETDEGLTQEQIRRRVAELGEWFHNFDLGGVVWSPSLG